MPSRRRFPRRLTTRWFATRGWAFGGAVAFACAALWLRPPGLPITWWWLAFGLGNAAAALWATGWWPEILPVRLYAVGATVGVALIRSWALFSQKGVALEYRAASAVIWLYIAYTCWLLAMLTSSFATRHNKS